MPASAARRPAWPSRCSTSAALKRGRFGAILAVGGGSRTPPRLVRLSYAPARARASVALVGKGITFDSGGLDLKRAGMGDMKSDMAGAAAVIESIIAAARLKLPIAVTATVPMAENAVSGSSYRPSDILVMRDGRTVEIDNTDAEGRLILADAILRACEDSPDYLIETATLTGGQVVALGTGTSGVMGTEAFRDRVVALGTAAGESLWPMPMPARLRTSAGLAGGRRRQPAQGPLGLDAGGAPPSSRTSCPRAWSGCTWTSPARPSCTPPRATTARAAPASSSGRSWPA